MFLGVEVGLVFFDGVLPRFLFQVLALRSRNCSEKILLMSGLPFLGSFSLSWFSVVVVFFFQRYSSGSHRVCTPLTHLFGLFPLFLSPPHLLSPVLAVRLFFLAFCRGAFLGPVRFGVFVGFSRYFGGLRLLAPSEALFLDARRQGCSGQFFPLFLFSPFCLVCGFFTPTRRGGPVIERGIPRVIAPAPRPSEGPGSAIVRGRLDTAFRDIFFASLFGRVTGTPGTIFGGEGAYIAILPPQVPFSHALFPHPRFFFVFCFFFFAFRARHSHWIA